MAASIEALELPVQLFAVGTVTGMTSALLQHRRTGKTEHWPVHVTLGVLFFFWLGILITAIEALG